MKITMWIPHNLEYDMNDAKLDKMMNSRFHNEKLLVQSIHTIIGKIMSCILGSNETKTA